LVDGSLTGILDDPKAIKLWNNLLLTSIAAPVKSNIDKHGAKTLKTMLKRYFALVESALKKMACWRNPKD